MLAYVDSSVVLRVIFGETDRLAEFGRIETGVSSEILRVECLRTLDRMRIRLSLTDEEVVERTEALFEVVDRLELVRVSSRVLDRASQPFSTLLGPLDALHLASAVLWQEAEHKGLTLLTHDKELALAARSLGMPVLGV